MSFIVNEIYKGVAQLKDKMPTHFIQGDNPNQWYHATPDQINVIKLYHERHEDEAFGMGTTYYGPESSWPKFNITQGGKTYVIYTTMEGNLYIGQPGRRGKKRRIVTLEDHPGAPINSEKRTASVIRVETTGFSF